MTEIKSISDIEFQKDEMILFKFFLLKNNLGDHVINSVKKFTKLDGIELVDYIKKTLSNTDPTNYISVLVYRTEGNHDCNKQYWDDMIILWGLFYNIHILMLRIKEGDY